MTARIVSTGDLSEERSRLYRQLIKSIRHQGPMRFDHYMEQALYAPDLGYYECRDSVFGASGDFVTAPGLGNFFAQAVARFCEAALNEIGGGNIAEYGAGEGQLARDLCEAMHPSPDSYVLIERARARRQAQQQEAPVNWSHSETLPDKFTGVVLANEFLDALPARCFAVTPKGVRERMVGLDEEERLCWVLQESEPASMAVARIFEDIGASPSVGYCSEWHHATVGNWLAELNQRLQRGVVLIIDYGYPRCEYYHPQRHSGTLRCHVKHQAHSDPFRDPGYQDISVDVDFTAVAEQATAYGLEVLMFTTQAGFLLEYGVLEAISETEDPVAQLAQRKQIEALTHPNRMGERFRVMALGRDFPVDLPHTICPDHRNRL